MAIGYCAGSPGRLRDGLIRYKVFPGCVPRLSGGLTKDRVVSVTGLGATNASSQEYRHAINSPAWISSAPARSRVGSLKYATVDIGATSTAPARDISFVPRIL